MHGNLNKEIKLLKIIPDNKTTIKKLEQEKTEDRVM